MPLTQGRIVGYDNERLAFKFTMLNGDETINCQISDAAMDELVVAPTDAPWESAHFYGTATYS
jgi:hypothetical protein